jgi:hypothetical protein
MPSEQHTLEQYLRDADANGAIDHTLRVRVQPGCAVTFYIHPQGQDGQTLEFVVGGNGLSCINVAGSPAPRIG